MSNERLTLKLTASELQDILCKALKHMKTVQEMIDYSTYFHHLLEDNMTSEDYNKFAEELYNRI